MSSNGGLYITIVYGSCHLLISLGVAILIYVTSRRAEERLSFAKFLVRVWKLRGVFTPLIIHIYDTSTDIGVLYEWYFLAQKEKKGENIKSLDMQLLFWVAMGCMLFYRFLLGCFGIFYANEQKWFESIFKCNCNENCNKIHHGTCCKILFRCLVGFVGSALELGVFATIYYEQKEIWGKWKKKSKKMTIDKECKDIEDNTTKNRNNNGYSDSDSDGEIEFGAGDNQKLLQFGEGVFESLPEAIMQSVFILRSYNDPDLNNNEEGDSAFLLLLSLSIGASILSIANKYIWVDCESVEFYCQSFLMSKKSLVQGISNQLMLQTKFEELPALDILRGLQNLGHDCTTIEILCDVLAYQSEFGYNGEIIPLVRLVNDTIVSLFVNYYGLLKNIKKMKSIANRSGNIDTASNKENNLLVTQESLVSTVVDAKNAPSMDLESFLHQLLSQQVTDDGYKGLGTKNSLKIDNDGSIILKYNYDGTDGKTFSLTKNLYLAIVQTVLMLGEREMVVKQLIWQISKNEITIDHWSVKRLTDNYFVCIGFIIRCIWRITAVTNRFLIISMIWAVMGGAFEFLLIPIMTVLWYMMIGCYASVKYHQIKNEHHLSLIQEEIGESGRAVLTGGASTAKAQSKNDNMNGDTGACDWCAGYAKKRLIPEENLCECLPLPCVCCLLLSCWSFAFLMIGVVLQLGMFLFNGVGFFIVRIIENIILMSIITWFAFDDSIDCSICANPDLRQASYNKRIFIWIVVGWISIVVHIISSIMVSYFLPHKGGVLNIESLATLEEHEKEVQKRKREKIKQFGKNLRLQSVRVVVE